MKRILITLFCLFIVLANIEFKPVNAATVTGYNYLNNGYIQFTDNLGSSWSDLPSTLIGNAVNDYGNLNNPYYFDGTVWRPLTLSRRMEYAVSEGGTLVSASDPYNVSGAGAIIYPVTSGPQLSNFTIDGSGIVMKEQSTTAGSVTYTGTLISKGEMIVNGKKLEFTNTYTLLEGKSFVRVKTKITNLSELEATNVRYWVGTGDDWISSEDVNTKLRGNIIDGAFVTSANSSVQSKAIRVNTQSGSDSILFYSTHPNVNTSVSGCCSFSNAVSVNPLNSVVSTYNDGSYAMFVNLGTIAVGASQEFDWYYAAGSAATILDTINDVALDSSGASNVTPTSATVAYTSETTTTGYYIVVPSGSSIPTANQIIGSEEYTSATVIKRGSSVMVAGVETAFDIDDLAPGTSYDLYFVTRNSESVTSSISLTRFSTQANAVISLLSITTIDVPKNHRVPDIEAIETDEYTATVSWSPEDGNFNNGVVYTATITITPKLGYTLTGVSANAFSVTGAIATNPANSGVITAVYPAVPLDFVNFHANGGSSVSSVAYDYDALLTEPLEVSRQGYEFAGWYEDNTTFSNPWNFGTEKMPSSDLNLYAKWTALDQNATFKANGGMGSDVVQVAKTDSTTALTSNTFTRAGYSFSGWARNSSAISVDYTNSQSITWFNTNTTLYAIWSANNQTITFNANGGVGSNTTQIAKTDSSTSLNSNTFTKQGYSFLGWSQNSSASTPDYTNSQMITWFNTNTYLYAVWSANDQTITFKANGGVGDDTTQIAKSDSSTALNANTFTKQGYSFVGWATSSSASSADYTNGQSITWFNTNTSLYAVWAADDQTITFNANGGVGDNTTQVAKSDSSTALNSNTFTKQGYSFVGWATSSSASSPDYTNGQSITWFNTNAYFYAVWAADDQTITFNANGGVGDNTTQIAKSDSSTVLDLNPFTKPGHTFIGWSLNPDASEESYVNEEEITWFKENKMFYAIWEINYYTVNYIENGGSSVSDLSVMYNTKLSVPTNPTRRGYAFSGWMRDTASTFYDFDLPVVSDLNLGARWNTVVYPISYDLAGGSANLVTSYTILDTINLGIPVRSGYTFNGWLMDGVSVSSIPSGTTGPLSLVARWTFAPRDPSLDDVVVSNVLIDSAEISSKVLSFGNPRAVAFGFELTNTNTAVVMDYATDSNLTLALSNLEPYTTYSIRAYANYGSKVIYTDNVEFTTQLPDVDEDGIPDTRDSDAEDSDKKTSYDNVDYDNPSALTLVGEYDEVNKTYKVKFDLMDLIDLNGDDTITIKMGNVEYTIPVALVDDLFLDNAGSYLELVVKMDESENVGLNVLDSVNMKLINAFDYNLFLVKSDGTSEQIHTFSGKIKVSISLEDIDDDSDPMDMEVYYFDEETKSLVAMNAEYDEATNSLVFYTDHFSYYVLGTKLASSFPFVWFGLGLLIILLFGLLVYKKRKANNA